MTKRQDLANALDALRQAATAAGVTEAERWHLDIGSKTYGRAYRLWLAHEDYAAGLALRAAGQEPAEWHTGHYTPALATDYLGMTAGEALHTLQTLRSAFLAVKWSQS